MRVGSLFSGIGGLELGLERAGMEVVWQAEYDKQARAVLARHWPGVHRYEDVHDVTQAEPVDVVCGGFPCQDYSVAGKRGGLAGDRGALWWEMHRIVAECRPTWVVGENVPGLLTSRGGRDFLEIVRSLVQLGYGVCWATLDSQYAGVAQRRRRLFIVGHSGGVPRPEVLALSEGLFGHPAPSREAGKGSPRGTGPGFEVAGTLGPRVSRLCTDECVNGSAIIVDDVANTLTARDIKGPLPSRQLGNVVVSPAIASTLNLNRDGAPIAFDTTQITSALNRSNPKPGDPCHPLAAGAHAPAIAAVVAFNGDQSTAVPRRLTPLECERLQGFPDGWTEYYADGSRVADGPRYRMLGNAVTVNVAEWIGRKIMENQGER